MSESIGLMEPMLPPESGGELGDLAIELVSKSSAFAGKLNPIVSQSVGESIPGASIATCKRSLRNADGGRSVARAERHARRAHAWGSIKKIILPL